MKKILVINGHPRKESFNGTLAAEYIRGAQESGAEVRLIHVTDMALEKYMCTFEGCNTDEAIKKAQEDITWADHLVFFHPVWWSSFPAAFKLFLDTVFASKFAFAYDGKSKFPKKLLGGRTAHIFLTLDTPIWVYKWIFGKPSVNVLKSRVLAFAGIAPTKVTYFSPVGIATKEQREGYLVETYKLGKKLA